MDINCYGYVCLWILWFPHLETSLWNYLLLFVSEIDILPTELTSSQRVLLKHNGRPEFGQFFGTAPSFKDCILTTEEIALHRFMAAVNCCIFHRYIHAPKCDVFVYMCTMLTLFPKYVN